MFTLAAVSLAPRQQRRVRREDAAPGVPVVLVAQRVGRHRTIVHRLVARGARGVQLRRVGRVQGRVRGRAEPIGERGGARGADGASARRTPPGRPR